MVTEPRDFGHLNDYWIDAYNLRIAIDKAFKDVPLYKDTVSPDTNTPAQEKYRQLNDGEIVMDGDEFWGPDRIWIPSIEIGKKVTTYTHKMYRRPLTETSSQMTDTCPDCSNHPCDCGLPAGYTPTPRTDANDLGWQFHEQYDYFDSLSNNPIQWVDFARILETELAAVTEQRDELLRYNEVYRQDHMICANCDAISIKEYKQAIEQRDRLAEAIRKHKFCDVELYEALQSLNQNANCAGTDASEKTL